MAAPRVSVVVPAYNAAWCIRRAVDSVLEQSHAPFEVIVVNDGSTDETSRVLADYGDRIRIIEQANCGLTAARNAGIQAAKGELIALLDADDYWLPDKLATQIGVLNENQDVGFCSTAALVVSESGEARGQWTCPVLGCSALHTIFERNAAVAGSGSSVLIRRELFEYTGLFDEGLAALEDIDMWMRLAAVCGYRCVEQPLTAITKREGSMSGDLAVMRRAALQVMKKNRRLLDKHSRGRFWNACYAGVLADYAKWEYREGHGVRATLHLVEGFFRSPFRRGRLTLGLLAGALTGSLQ